MKEIYQGDRRRQRADRTRYLGASAALAMAEPVVASTARSRWSSRWRNLKTKKAKMEDALKAYALAPPTTAWPT